MLSVLRLNRCFVVALLALIGMAQPAGATVIGYHFDLDTAAINGTGGSLDVQFNPGPGGSQAANASVQDFLTDGSLAGTSVNDGAASGTLPNILSIDNTQVLNAVFQGTTYGDMISFDLFLSGPVVDNPDGTGSGSVFALFLLNSFDVPLLTTDFFGTVLSVDLDPNGIASVSTFDADASGTPSIVSYSEIGPPSAAPAPGSLILLLLGLAGLRSMRRRIG